MDDFLKGQSEAGTFDSRGEFTVALEKQMRIRPGFDSGKPLRLLGNVEQKTAACFLKIRYFFQAEYVKVQKSDQFRSTLVRNPSRCHWIRDGAICYVQELRALTSDICAEIYLSADGLPSDLTGFVVRPCEESERRLQVAYRALADQASATYQALEGYKAGPFAGHVKDLGGAVAAMAVLLGVVAVPQGALLTALATGAPVAAIGGAMALGLSSADQQKVVDDCLTRLRWVARAPHQHLGVEDPTPP